MNNNYITLTIGKKKNIALIAHDNKKADLIEWCEQNKDILTQHFFMRNRNNCKDDHR